jgi:diguanylate cyclase (GGDEF)-like protein
MRHRVFGFILIATMLAVGASLAATAIATREGPSPLGSTVALIAVLVGTGAMVVGMLRRIIGSTGLIPLLTGGVMLAVSAAAGVVPAFGALVAEWAVAANLEAGALSLIAQAGGSLLVALGCARWAGDLVGSSGDADDRSSVLQEDTEELRTKIKILRDQLQSATTADSLTGVLNRRTFIERLDETIQRDTRLRKSFAFLLIDITGMRTLNERMGRLEGDAALQRVAAALGSATRGTDVVGRLGGDSFGVVLPECSDAHPAITRILLAFQDAPMAGEDADHTGIAVHIGSVEVPNASWCLGFSHVYKLAEERVRSLRNIQGSHMARVALERPKIDGVA